MKSTYYITTPIYYVNDLPHIGHAYTTLACDVLARFMRLNGKDVRFLTGTDEHGQKVEKSALNAGISPQEFTDKVSERFRELTKTMNFSNDDFIRTTEERHKIAAREIWKRLKDSGNIYLDKYCGWYSVRDEAFYSEDELTEDGKAPTGAPVEWLEEPSYFFALSKWQDKLLEFYEANPDFIAPKSRRNEVISFVKSGLQDLSVSRTTFKWGIPVPGDENHIMYVWLDALTNYLSAIGFPDTESSDFKKYWPADVHVVGKDILRFHAVYWPAFLMAAGIEPPKRIMAHGWWTNEGQKISKSLGNVIDPNMLVAKYGLDQTRYFLMKEITFGNDGNFSDSSMVNRINSELSNNIGNLAQRTLAFINKHADSKVPQISESKIKELYNNELLQYCLSLRPELEELMLKQDFSNVLDKILNIANKANLYIDQAAPWSLRKTDPEKMLESLYILAEAIRYLAILLQPFMPDSAAKILDTLNIAPENRNFDQLNFEGRLQAGNIINIAEPVFMRYSEAA